MSYIFSKKQFNELEKRVARAQKELKEILNLKANSQTPGDTWHGALFKIAYVEEMRASKKLIELKKLVAGAKIVEPKQQNQKVDIGNRVIIEHEDGFQEELISDGYIVNAPDNHFSFYSPIGKALKGAKKGQTKAVQIQDRKQKIKILDILFPNQNE